MIMFTKPKTNSERIKNVILDGLDRIEKENVDRAVIYISEIEPKEDISTFVNLDRLRYYDFNDLTRPEQDMIMNRLNYNVISLVQPSVFGNELYDQRGLEFYERYVIDSAFLPKSVPESSFNYYTQGTIYYGSYLEGLCKFFADNDWTEKDLTKSIDHGINEYKARTREMIHTNDALQSTLKAIEERNMAPFDQIMRNLRNKIGSKK